MGKMRANSHEASRGRRSTRGRVHRPAELKDDFEAIMRTDPDLRDNWDTVKEWNESSRYARTTKAKAEKLYEAITDKQHGVLSWLKLHW